MGKRRHFVISFVAMAVLLLLVCGLWPRRLVIDAVQAQTITRLWLAADYRQSLEDPALRGASSNATNNATNIVQAHESAPITFKHFEWQRPIVKPLDAAHAALVRAEILYSNLPPPDGENVRCFLLIKPKPGAEADIWQVRREISESAYRWRLGL